MKRLLLSLLIISSLTSSFAWASHPEALTGHVSSDNSVLSFGGEQPPMGDLPQHDHYCSHGMMDLLGLSLFVAMIDLPCAGRNAFAYEASLATHISLLPTKPPRA